MLSDISSDIEIGSEETSVDLISAIFKSAAGVVTLDHESYRLKH